MENTIFFFLQLPRYTVHPQAVQRTHHHAHARLEYYYNISNAVLLLQFFFTNIFSALPIFNRCLYVCRCIGRYLKKNRRYAEEMTAKKKIQFLCV